MSELRRVLSRICRVFSRTPFSDLYHNQRSPILALVSHRSLWCNDPCIRSSRSRNPANCRAMDTEDRKLSWGLDKLRLASPMTMTGKCSDDSTTEPSSKILIQRKRRIAKNSLKDQIPKTKLLVLPINHSSTSLRFFFVKHIGDNFCI